MSILLFVLIVTYDTSLIVWLVLQMGSLVAEKELGLRQALRNMGMQESSYWASWALFDVIMSCIIALLICIFGKWVMLRANAAGPAYQRLPLWCYSCMTCCVQLGTLQSSICCC